MQRRRLKTKKKKKNAVQPISTTEEEASTTKLQKQEPTGEAPLCGAEEHRGGILKQCGDIDDSKFTFKYRFTL